MHLLSLKFKGKKPKTEPPIPKLSIEPQKFTEEERTVWYCVLQGPRPGIYTDYKEVSLLHPNAYKTAYSKAEAEKIMRHQESSKKVAKDLKAKYNGHWSQSIRAYRENPFKELDTSLIKKGITIDEFINIINTAKVSKADGLVTIQRTKESLKIMALKGANPTKIRQCFEAGILDTIYPDENLAELQELPSTILEAIQRFVNRPRIKENGKGCFLRLWCSIPDWEGEKFLPGYCLGKIGPNNENFSNPPEVEMAIEEIDHGSLPVLRYLDLMDIEDEVQKLKPTDRIKVNYYSGNCLLISRFNKEVSREDWERIQKFRTKIGQLDGISDATKQAIAVASGNKTPKNDVMADARKEDFSDPFEEVTEKELVEM